MQKKIITNILLPFAVLGFTHVFASGASAQQQSTAIGAATTAPVGYLQFCRDNPDDCAGRDAERTTISLGETSWRKIVRINAEVNREIIAMTDQDHWGMPEHWSYPEDGKGDCEDYVLEKRRRLIKAGFPEQTLLITVVRDHKGEGHAVLTVKTDRGDFVLDNQAGKILAWHETGYRFIKRQSDTNTSRWVSLGGIGSPNVASTR